MRRLSLLLFLIVLACAASLATAEKPFELTDGAIIPYSATTVSTKEFTWRDKAGTTTHGWLAPSVMTLQPGCAATLLGTSFTSYSSSGCSPHLKPVVCLHSPPLHW